MRNRRHILNVLNTKAEGIQGAYRRFATRARPANLHVEVLDAEIERHAAGLLRRNLRRERRGFARAAKPATAGGRPGQGIALTVRYRDDRVVEGRMNVGDRVDHMLLDLLFLCFCHI